MARPRAPGSKRLPFSTPRNLATCSARRRKYSLLSIDTPMFGISGSLSETVKVAANSNADVNNKATKRALFATEVPRSWVFTFDRSPQLHRSIAKAPDYRRYAAFKADGSWGERIF